MGDGRVVVVEPHSSVATALAAIGFAQHAAALGSLDGAQSLLELDAAGAESLGIPNTDIIALLTAIETRLKLPPSSLDEALAHVGLQDRKETLEQLGVADLSDLEFLGKADLVNAGFEPDPAERLLALGPCEE